MVSRILGQFFKHATLPWIVLFFLVNLMVTQDGGENARSRFAGMRAVLEQKSFSIDRYKDWTIDWARTPDGRYFSNKAPGGMFLGTPVLGALDFFSDISRPKVRDEFGRRTGLGYFDRTLIVFLLQVIPYAILLFFLVGSEKGAGIHLLAILLFFGQTTSLLMNSYFGHGLAALFVLSGWYFGMKLRSALCGFFLGWAMLTDYLAVFALLPAALAIGFCSEPGNRRGLTVLRSGLKFALGGVVPGGLWVWYHTQCFGSPFRTALQFQNPAFLTGAGTDGTSAFAGALSILPRGEALWGLIFSSSRGLLFTQPWVFLLPVSVFVAWKHWRPEQRAWLVAAIAGFVSSVWVISAYKDWHGGYFAGPRYLAAIMPLLALVMFYAYPFLSGLTKSLLWMMVGISVCFRALVFTGTILAPPENLWAYYLKGFSGDHAGTALLRFALFLVSAGACFFWVRRKTLIPIKNSR